MKSIRFFARHIQFTTIASVAGIDGDFPGISVFDLDPDAVRLRYHLTYGYGDNPKAPGYLFPMHEWQVGGSPYAIESWQPGMRYEPGVDQDQD